MYNNFFKSLFTLNEEMNDHKKNKFVACMLLHALGDTIGFKNGDWEFNHHNKMVTYDFSNTLLFEFIELGGINRIDLKDWYVSDDTVMHLATTEGLLEEFKTPKEFGDILAKKYIKLWDNLTEKVKIGKETDYKRATGLTVLSSLDVLRKGTEWNKLPYHEKSGGNGGAMRTLCIGLAFHGQENRKKLIYHSLDASRVTHNSVFGYLGGVSAALFTAYAIEGILPEKWPFKLIKILESNIVDKYLKSMDAYFHTFPEEKEKFIDTWKKYLSWRFDDHKKFIKMRYMQIPAQRSNKFLHTVSNISIEKNPGNMGHDSVIIAYDALMDCVLENGKPSWEKFVVYSMLHFGDSDTTGSIGGGLYGAYYGLEDVPENNLKYLEMKDELIKVANQLYEKYH